MECWRCESPIPLGNNDFVWRVGPYDFYLGKVPSYMCMPCDSTFFPEEVRGRLADLVERELDRIGVPAPFPNPRAIAFARKYST